jgi:phage shock protein A
MLTLFTTLARGTVAEVEEAIFEANAIRILQQQLRDAAAALEHSRRELACAMAHQASEERAIATLSQRIAELEVSGRKAIAGGRDDLAEEAAIEIAATEDERNERTEVAARGDVEIKRIRQLVDDGRKRLLELRRGVELAKAQEALRRAGANGRRAIAAGKGALRDAETTLAKIRQTHTREQDVGAALEELERASSGRDLDERLANAGFGATQKTKPADVLARLRARPAPEAVQPIRS